MTSLPSNIMRSFWGMFASFNIFRANAISFSSIRLKLSISRLALTVVIGS